MPITFRDLENFVICAQSKTLSEASEKLGMAQSSLSLGLKKAEADLGYPLFYRGRDGIKLTPQGRNLLPEAKDILQALGRIEGQKNTIKFRIGCHPSVGMFVLGEFLRTMQNAKPEVDFEVVNASSIDINKKVARGEIDFGVVMNPISIQGLIIKSIGEDDVGVWESKRRYQQKLIYNPHMLQALSILSRWKGAPTQSIDVENLELIAYLTNSGAGYGILPSKVVESQRYDLIRVAHTPSFKDHLALVCYPEMLKSNEGKLIFETLKKSFR